MSRPQTETTFYITQNLILPGKASISASHHKTARLQMLAQNASIDENENLDITNSCMKESTRQEKARRRKVSEESISGMMLRPNHFNTDDGPGRSGLTRRRRHRRLRPRHRSVIFKVPSMPVATVAREPLTSGPPSHSLASALWPPSPHSASSI